MPECRNEQIKDLISHILVVDVDQRYTIDQIKAHPAFSMHLPLGYQIPTPLHAPNITKPIETDDKKFFTLLKNIGFESDEIIKEELSSSETTAAKIFYYMYTQRRLIKSLPWSDKIMRNAPRPLEPFLISADDIGLPSQYAHIGSPMGPPSSLYASFKDSTPWVLPSSDALEDDDDGAIVRNYLSNVYSVKQMELVAEMQSELGEQGYNYFFPNDIMLIVHRNEQDSYFTITMTQQTLTESVVSIDQIYGPLKEFEELISIVEGILSKYTQKI